MANEQTFNHDKFVEEQRAKHGAYAGFAVTAIATFGLFFAIPELFSNEASTAGYPQTVAVALISISMVALMGFCSWHLFKYKSWKSALALVLILAPILVSTFLTQGRPNIIVVIVLFFAVRGLIGARGYQKINTAMAIDVFD